MFKLINSRQLNIISSLICKQITNPRIQSFARNIKKSKSNESEGGYDSGEHISASEFNKQLKKNEKIQFFQEQREMNKIIPKKQDKMLDDVIGEMVDSGLNDYEIMSNILGQGSKVSKQKEKPLSATQKLKQDKIVRDLGLSGLKDEAASGSFFDLLRNTENPQVNQIDKEAHMYVELNQILKEQKQSEKDILPAMTIKDMVTKKKLTKAEVLEYQLEKAAKQGLFFSGGMPANKVDGTIYLKDSQQKIDLEEVYDNEQKRQKLSEEDKTVKNELEEQNEFQKKKAIKQGRSQQELKEDLKMRAVEHELQLGDDKKFRKLAEIDFDKAAKEVDISLKDEDMVPQKYESGYIPTILEKSQREIQRLMQIRGIDYSTANKLMKEYVFGQKKLEEENEEFKKYLDRKEKKKELKKIIKEMHEVEYKEEIDYKTPTTKLNKKLMKDPTKLNEILEDVQKINSEFSKTLKNDNNLFEYYKEHSTQNILNFFEHFFNQPKQSIKTILMNQPIYLKEIKFNDAATVIHVFWELSQLTQTHNRDDEYLCKQIQKNLVKATGYIRAQIAKQLQFKYAPELRFHLSVSTEKLKEIREELKSKLPEIIKKELKETANNPNNSNIYTAQEDYEATYLKMMEDLENSSAMIKKKKTKYQRNEEGNIIRNNKNDDGTKKKYVKTDKAKVFWDTLSL